MSAETSENIPSNSSQKLADNYTSKAEHENLQQIVHTLENSFQKQITDLQAQVDGLQSSNEKQVSVSDIEKLQSTKLQMSEKC